MLATKTQQRSGEGVREHLERSLRMLRTDRIDLYQLHQIAQETDWEAVTAPGGALEEALRAREAGKIRYLGVTSHSLPMALKMIRTGLFSTVQFPFNFIEEAAADELLPAARQLGMGFIVMKPFGGGAIDNAEAAFKYLRQHHGIVPIPGFESTAQIDEVFSFTRPQHGHGGGPCRHGALSPGVGQTLLPALRILPALPPGGHDHFGHGVPDPGQPHVAAGGDGVSQGSMESVPQCTECGLCIQRCPYDLPVPEIIKSHCELYRRHLAERDSSGPETA